MQRVTTMDRAKAAEDDYFKQQEAEARRSEDWDAQRQKALDQKSAREREIALQIRRCPKCRIALVPEELRQVSIERCNSCNGVWLDEGKLERLMQSELGFVERMLRAVRAI